MSRQITIGSQPAYVVYSEDCNKVKTAIFISTNKYWALREMKNKTMSQGNEFQFSIEVVEPNTILSI